MPDTLLDMTQEILAELDGDAVNSITDTVEANSVATIIRSVCKDIIEEHDIPGRADFVSLEGLANPDKPTHMKLPEDVSRIEWIKYDCRIEFAADKLYRDMEFKEPLEFVTYCNARPSTDTTNYQVVEYSANIPIIVGKLAAPTFWTSFDDTYIVFDSYDSLVDSTLQSSKTISHGYIRPTLALSDTAVPPLPENLIRQLYHQSLARCSINLKTVVNPKAERNESRFRVRGQRNKWRQGRKVHQMKDWGR